MLDVEDWSAEKWQEARADLVHCELVYRSKEFTVYSYITICEPLRISFSQIVIFGGTD